MGAEPHSFKLGKFECLVIQDQTATMPLANLVAKAEVVLKIASQGEQLLHLADAVIHPIFVEHRDWVSTYDAMPDRALAVKRRLLDWAAFEEALVFGAHFPFPGLGYVRHGEKAWKWLPVTATR
jgi:glyoxylase-like metal-dependent hydrolase (beta-lactamase superfamily II)